MALSYPETFGRCASFSGALMLGSREYLEKLKGYQDPGRKSDYVEMEEIDRSMYYGALGAYGPELEYRPEDDLLSLGKKAMASGAPLPEVLLTCGTEDFLLEVNQSYSQKLNEMGIFNQLKTWPGIHNWLFWEESIRDYIDFFV